MFERFTDRARKVMALANQEAQRFNHKHITPEHVLLGLLKEGSGVGASFVKKILKSTDLRPIRLEIEAKMKSGPEACSIGKLPQAPSTTRVIELAIEIARELNHNYVGTEHLLLGLLRFDNHHPAGDWFASEILEKFGVTFDKARQEIVGLINGESSASQEGSSDLPAREKIERTLGEEINLKLGGTDATITLAGTRHCRVTVGDSGMPIPDLRISGGIVACLVAARLSGGHINVARLIELLQALPIHLQH